MTIPLYLVDVCQQPLGEDGERPAEKESQTAYWMAAVAQLQVRVVDRDVGRVAVERVGADRQTVRLAVTVESWMTFAIDGPRVSSVAPSGRFVLIQVPASRPAGQPAATRQEPPMDEGWTAQLGGAG